MRKLLLAGLLLPALAIGQSGFQYPETRKTDTVDVYHGVQVPDPYRWLEDDRSEETKNWVTEQNKVTFAYLDRIPYRADWLKRMEEINNYAKYGSPFREKEYFYYYRNDGLQNQSVLFRQKGLDGKPELVIDPNKFSKTGTTSLAVFSLSHDGRYAVVGKSSGGSDWRDYFVMDMNTLQYLPDSVAWVKVSGAQWQGNGFYYSRYPKPEKGTELSTRNLNHQVYYHKVGTSQDQDELVYEDPANPERFHFAITSEDERYVFLSISDRGKGKDGNALWFNDSREGSRKFRPLIAEVGNYDYSFIHEVDGKFLVLTDDGAQNRRVL